MMLELAGFGCADSIEPPRPEEVLRDDDSVSPMSSSIALRSVGRDHVRSAFPLGRPGRDLGCSHCVTVMVISGRTAPIVSLLDDPQMPEARLRSWPPQTRTRPRG